MTDQHPPSRSNAPRENTTREHTPREPWHLDKRVNISVIAVLLAQAVMFGVAWGNIENRVAQLELGRHRFDTVPERLAAIEATLLAIKERIDRMDRAPSNRSDAQ